MDNGEAMYWLAIIQQANEGSKEAKEMLRQENELRVESGRPTVQEALKQKADQAAKPYINPDPIPTMTNGEELYWAKIIYQADRGNRKALEMLRQENELRVESGRPTLKEALKRKAWQAAHPYINPDPDEKDLNKILMEDGKETAQEWLMTQPEAWREIETEAIYECLKRGWTLHTGHIQMIARELDAKRNPKGW